MQEKRHAFCRYFYHDGEHGYCKKNSPEIAMSRREDRKYYAEWPIVEGLEAGCGEFDYHPRWKQIIPNIPR